MSEVVSCLMAVEGKFLAGSCGNQAIQDNPPHPRPVSLLAGGSGV